MEWFPGVESTMTLIEEEDGWQLVLVAGVVRLLQIDYTLGFILGDAHDDAKLTVENECRLIQSGREAELIPEESSSLSPILAFANAKVSGISVRKTGHLKLEFGSGARLEVGPDERYEAWHLGLSIGVLMVCAPGGEVALFRDRKSTKPA